MSRGTAMGPAKAPAKGPAMGLAKGLAMLRRSRNDDQLRYMAQSVRLEETVRPRLVRSTMLLIGASVLVFIVWASQASVNELATAAGEVVPQGLPQSLQHLEGGIVEAIQVREGQQVERGDVLVRLSGAGVHEDLEQALRAEVSLRMDAIRLRAYVENQPIDLSDFADDFPEMAADQLALFNAMLTARDEERAVLAAQTAQQENRLSIRQSELQTARDSLALTQDLHQRQMALAQQGYFAETAVLETRRELTRIQGEVAVLEREVDVATDALLETNVRLSSLNARLANESRERLALTEVALAQTREQVDKLADRVQRLDVRAPVGGLVTAININTVGAVVQPGETLMQILPLDRPLVVQLSISPRHIGHIVPGQSVNLSFSTFDSAQYGTVDGVLDSISATTFTGNRGEPYYRAEVALAQNYVGDNPLDRVVAGMTVSADIVTGEKTVLEFLLKPIQQSLQSSFSER